MAKLLVVAVVLVLLLAPALAFGWKFHRQRKPPAEVVPLNDVAAQVVKTLDTFNAGADSQSLPKLSKVTFDFNATGTTVGGFSFNVLLFRAGASREVDTTNEVTFTYTVPSPAGQAVGAHTATAAHDFSAALLSTLQAAAAQIKATQNIGPAKFTDLTVTLAYGVIRDTSVGGSGTLSLVTLDGSLDRKRSDVQTLTLTFGQ